MTNEQLYEAALAAISALFSDRSVSRETAVRNLRNLCDELSIMLDTL